MHARHLISYIVLLNTLCSAQTTTWTQIKPTTSPSARIYLRMTYDAARSQRVVLFGGWDSSSLSDTWAWDGKAWTQIKPNTTPSARSFHAMAYDASRQGIVLFGGLTNSGELSDTWFYGIGDVPSRAAPYGASCGATLAAATNSRPIIGKLFVLHSTGFATTAALGLMTVGASKTSYRGFPLPLSLNFAGMKGCYLHTSFDVSFGFPVFNGAGSFAFNVPNHVGFLGSKSYLQSVAGLKTTNGVEIVIGNR